MNCTLTKDQLIDLYVNQNKTDSEIAMECGCQGWHVSRLRTKLGIKGINARQREFSKRPAPIDLSARQKSIILGMLLGDGCLKPSGPRAYLSVSHSEKQLDYLLWIRNELLTIFPNQPKLEIHHEKYKMFALCSETRSDLADIRSKIYIPEKVVVDEIFSGIDDLSLAVWFMDDGSLNYVNKSRSQYSFATNGFTQEDVYKLKQIMMNNFGVEVEVKPTTRRNGKTQFVLCVSDSCFEKFKSLVTPHIVPSMNYKLGIDVRLVDLNSELDKDALTEMYCVKGMTQTQMANATGLGVDTIRRKMDQFGIAIRSSSDAQLGGKNSRLERGENGSFAGIKWGKEEEDMVKSLFDQLRAFGIEPAAIDLAHGVGIIDHVKSLKAEQFRDESGFKYCRTGMNLCTSLFPHTLDMASTGSLSPRQIFLDDRMLCDCIARTIRYAKRANLSSVTHGLKTYRNNRSVTFFPPAWGKFAIDVELNGKSSLKMLDFSAGFGGRMIGAYASGRIERYIGIDPIRANIDSLGRVSEIIQRHARLSGASFGVELYCDTAENVLVKLPKGFDLIMTSPPYFNKERYSEEDSQCYVKFSEYDEWRDSWLKPTLTSAIGLLNDGGKIIIFAGNWGKFPVGDDCGEILASVTGNQVRKMKFFLPSIEYLRKNGAKRFETAWIAEKRESSE